MRTYISDIYNVKTNKRFKYINPKSISSEYYCVEIRDTATDEQIALCRPDEMLEDKYRCSYGVVIRLNEGLSKYLKVLTKLVITKPESAKCAEDIVRNFYNSNDKILFKAGK